MPDDPTVTDDVGPAPTAEQLAGTIFEGVGDYRNDNGGAVFTAEAAVGGGDG